MKPKLTAVEWLAGELSGHLGPSCGPELVQILEQAKAMEREQHGHTWDEALIQVDKRGGVILRALVDFDNYWPSELDQKV